MAEKKRTPLQVKDKGVQRMIDSYRQNTRGECPPEKVREFEKKMEKEILPRAYEK